MTKSSQLSLVQHGVSSVANSGKTADLRPATAPSRQTSSFVVHTYIWMNRPFTKTHIYRVASLSSVHQYQPPPPLPHSLLRDLPPSPAWWETPLSTKSSCEKNWHETRRERGFRENGPWAAVGMYVLVRLLAVAWKGRSSSSRLNNL